jgi:hypothetical protein
VSSSATAHSCAGSCGQAAASASGATRMCCAGCDARRSPRCARRLSRPSSERSRASCRPGRAWMRPRPVARASTASANCWCRSRASRWLRESGSATCSLGVWAPTRRPGWTSCAPAASWCGWEPAPSGNGLAEWPCTSATMRAGWARPRSRASRPPGRRRTGCVSGWPREPRSGPTCSPTWVTSSPRSSRRPCGTWPGPARPPTTPSRRCALRASRSPRETWKARGASPGAGAPGRRRCRAAGP